MESGKRSKNFTEREKMLLIEVAKEFVTVIDNKKTDGSSVEAKKQAWRALANRYNAVSETGPRSEKQLHALYDNLKKKARKNMSDDKSELYKTGGGTFCPKTTTIDEKVVALLTPQFKPLSNEFDSSASYYNLATEQASEETCHETEVLTTQDIVVVLEDKENIVPDVSSSYKQASTNSIKRPLSQLAETAKTKKICLTETKKKTMNNLSDCIIKRKNPKTNK